MNEHSFSFFSPWCRSLFSFISKRGRKERGTHARVVFVFCVEMICRHELAAWNSRTRALHISLIIIGISKIVCVGNRRRRTCLFRSKCIYSLECDCMTEKKHQMRSCPLTVQTNQTLTQRTRENEKICNTTENQTTAQWLVHNPN